MPDDTDFIRRARLIPKGRLFEDFAEGQTFQHHWGRTINASDASLFATLTLAFNPSYFNLPYAQAHGHRDIVVNPLFVFNTVLGLSVEDLSEAGGPFLGIDGLRHLQPVYAGDTLYARSTTLAARESQSNPGAGIVTWRTEGFRQDGTVVIEFMRSNLIRKRLKGNQA